MGETLNNFDDAADATLLRRLGRLNSFAGSLKVKKLSTRAVIAAMVFGLLPHGPVQAVLSTGDSLEIGLPNLVVDSNTGLQWLSPYATRNHLYNDSYVKGLVGQYGLRYATADEALFMINSNFGSPTASHPGDAEGFQAAQSFFNVFGVNLAMGCGGGPCPRTQGFTSTQGADPLTQYGFGMIQFGSSGYMLAYNQWHRSFADLQMGSWLIRDPSIVPSATTMIGEALTFSRLYPTVNDFYLPPQNRVVRNGTDDQLLFGGYTRVNAEANEITFEVLVDSLYVGTGTVFDGYRVSGFSKDIYSVALVDNTTGHALTLDHDARSLTVSLGQPLLHGGTSFRLDVQFAPPSPVPEAPTAWMMGAALLAFAVRACKRCQSGAARV